MSFGNNCFYYKVFRFLNKVHKILYRSTLVYISANYFPVHKFNISINWLVKFKILCTLCAIEHSSVVDNEQLLLYYTLYYIHLLNIFMTDDFSLLVARKKNIFYTKPLFFFLTKNIYYILESNVCVSDINVE